MQWVKRNRLHSEVKLPMRTCPDGLICKKANQAKGNCLRQAYLQCWKLGIGLTQSNLDRGEELLMSVSHPDSESYGKHFTAEEVVDIFAPAEDTVDAVRSWLEGAGISKHRISQSVNKQWLQFDVKVAEAEELLKAQYHFYEHQSMGKHSIACDEYHVPADIQPHIDYITPGIKLYATNTGKSAPGELEKRTFGIGPGKGNRKPPKMPIPPSLPTNLTDILTWTDWCSLVISPECISTMYNVTLNKEGGYGYASPGNQLGIFEDLADYYSQTDLNLFFLALAPYIPQGTHPTLEGIDGGQAPTTDLEAAGPESDLDFQISYPLIWPQNSVLFQTDDAVYEANYTYVSFLNNFLDAIDGSYCTNSPLDPPYPDPAPGGYNGSLQCGVYQPTNVISISYSSDEATLPLSYQRRQCDEFMKLGMQGVSVCVASGDSGVEGDDGCLGPDYTIFNPDFPATCPYVTTLGSTYLPIGAQAAADEEVATTRFPSGGG
jgi:tripeptidyl-peptidase I